MNNNVLSFLAADQKKKHILRSEPELQDVSDI